MNRDDLIEYLEALRRELDYFIFVPIFVEGQIERRYAEGCEVTKRRALRILDGKGDGLRMLAQ